MNFDEVVKVYTEEDALEEANRCLQCAEPKCIEGCPVKVNIRGFINQIRKNNYDAALLEIKKTNNLPGICGRVCPQEKQCQASCVLGKNAIQIGKLERFAADMGKAAMSKLPANRKRVAVIGSGPSGLTCASDLAVLGYEVTVFEALHHAGGVLTYGIPEFRLPKAVIDNEVKAISELGVDIRLNHVIGKIIRLEELDHDAVFIGNGAGLPKFLGIPGESLLNVFSANEFLVRNNLMKAYDFPQYKTPIKKNPNVVVIGGGNVAVDSARVAKRLGSEVTIVYRRTREQMPARAEEVENALKEGVKLLELTNPVEILGDTHIEAVRCQVMELGNPDPSGRPKPVANGKNKTISCDQVIIAIGQKPNPILENDLRAAGIRTDEWGAIIVDGNMQTTNPRFFAGGDIIGGNATVIKAMGNGRTAAKAIDRMLKKKD